MQAPMQAMVTHDVVIVRSRKAAQARVMAVPPEEFGIKKNARSIRESNYCFHKLTQLTEGDLIAQGYDEDQVKKLPAYNPVTNTEELARDSVNEYQLQGSGANRSTRQIEVIEHYIRMDYKGDGKPCLYKVTTGGSQGEVLLKDGKPDIEPFDMMPFAAMTPVIITHRFFGRSVADLVMDIQRIKTALYRGLLDNQYLHNNPRVEVAEANAGPNTLDDLLVSRPGGIVRTKTPGGLNWQVVPDIAGSVFPVLEYFDSVTENRTGVTKRGQGLDADALMNQTATAAQLGHSAAQERMKLIARIFAETGIKDLFILLHGTIRKHGKEQQQTVRLRNQWIKVDPRDWKNRNDMTVKVGIGSGGKSEQIAVMRQILEIQKEAMVNGLTNLVSPKKIFNAVEQLCVITGHKDAKQYFLDPEEKDQQGNLVNPPPQPTPDPAMLKIQADAQLKQAELAQRNQEMAQQAQIDQIADMRKAEIEKVQAEADIATQDRKTQAEMILAQQKFEFERELKLMDHQLKREAQQADLEMRREQHRQAMEAGVFKIAQGQQAHEHRMESASKSEDKD